MHILTFCLMKNTTTFWDRIWFYCYYKMEEKKTTYFSAGSWHYFENIYEDFLYHLTWEFDLMMLLIDYELTTVATTWLYFLLSIDHFFFCLQAETAYIETFVSSNFYTPAADATTEKCLELFTTKTVFCSRNKFSCRYCRASLRPYFSDQ